MSFTHDLIFALEHPEATKGRRKKLISSPCGPGRLAASPARGDSDYEDDDFDDETITGMTADEVRQVLREVREYGKKGKSIQDSARQ